MNSICINNQNLEGKEWNGQRVVTFKDIDTVHRRPNGTSRRNFSKNKKRFIENVDFYRLTVENTKMYEFRTFKIPVRGIMVFTESGYLMLVKSFTDDLAWEVQRQLVNGYFKSRLGEISTTPNTPPLKTYHNAPVLITTDLCRIFGVSRWVIYQEVKAWKVENVNLQHFLKENPNLPNTGGKAYNLYFKQFVMDYAAKKGVSQEVLEMLEHYFNQKRERPAYMDIELFRKVRTLELFYHSGKMFFIDKEFAEDFTRLVSKKFKDLGLMEEGVSDPMDLSIHNAPGWNLRGALLDFYDLYR